jgi:hypothetical protein
MDFEIMSTFLKFTFQGLLLRVRGNSENGGEQGLRTATILSDK